MKVFLTTAVATLAVATAQPSCAKPMAVLDLCAMKPAFMEEFDTMSIASTVLGSARWIAHTPWNGDFGDARFTDPGPGEAFAVSGGMLHITASKAPDGRWRSGLIAAADASGRGEGVREGYFETRMSLPPGPGTWPAFWLSTVKPAGDPGPSVEVDVIEYYGHMTGKYSSALHVWYKGADKDRSRHDLRWTPVPAGSLVEQFHRYGVRVASDMITFYLDRVPVAELPTPAELKTPLFPLVNLALGSGYPIDGTPNPSTLLVDYVHVYAFDPAGRDARCKGPAADTP